jgi:hypothetical protein
MSDLDLSTFYALREGAATQPDGGPCRLTTHDLGTLRARSGQVGACDPFVYLSDPAVEEVPPGDYPVRVTVADVSEAADGSHLREAYLSLVLSDAPSVRAAYARNMNGSATGSHDLGIVGVDAGTVAFVDAAAIRSGMPDPRVQNWYDALFDNGTTSSWFALMDDPGHLRAGCASIPLPLSEGEANVVLAHSGWGDGAYPLVFTLDAAGRPTGLHIDLLVAGPLDPDLG